MFNDGDDTDERVTSLQASRFAGCRADATLFPGGRPLDQAAGCLGDDPKGWAERHLPARQRGHDQVGQVVLVDPSHPEPRGGSEFAGLAPVGLARAVMAVLAVVLDDQPQAGTRTSTRQRPICAADAPLSWDCAAATNVSRSGRSRPWNSRAQPSGGAVGHGGLPRVLRIDHAPPLDHHAAGERLNVPGEFARLASASSRPELLIVRQAAKFPGEIGPV